MIESTVEYGLAIMAGMVLLVAGVSRTLTGTSLTPAMVFAAAGVLLGPLVLDELTLSPTGHSVRTLAEATLTPVLFTDASRINLSALRGEYTVPLRLLGVGLPLTIGLGALIAAVLFDQLDAGEVAILAIVLAPTDAALGEAVVTEPRLPSRIRQGLNVESGLNDGICVPLLLIALAVASVEGDQSTGAHAVSVIAEEIGYGVLGGAAAGVFSAELLLRAGRRQLITPLWRQAVPLAGAALAYGLASGLGGSGFIAAFVAGLIFGRRVGDRTEAVSRFTEGLSALLGGITFLVFGAVLLGPSLEQIDWRIALYGVLSLTVARMLPVAVAMLGSGARWPTLAFLGWFGPRGLASIVFAVIVVEESQLPGVQTILLTTYLTVGLSVLAHGVTAAPLARRYADWYERRARARRTMESIPAARHRARSYSPGVDVGA
jgi:NhaP-type Na+/H+ or K+/H+ antiporter